MACYHPLKGFIIGKTKNGKNDLLVSPFDTECVYQPYQGASWERHGHVLDRNVFKGRIITNYVQIPCGQCIGCRLEYSRQWAIRCMLESEYHDENYFITLTYDDAHVPYSEYVDDDGVISTAMTLVKKDVQDFIKRVRRSLEYNGKDGFRYFACGEYGERTARPHYHMIAFGLHLDDLVLYKNTPTGSLYTSEFLSSKWQHGYVIIGSVTFESCAYVSRYITKKWKGNDNDIYSRYNIAPLFSLCSRRPGLGKSYFEDNFDDIYPRDSICLVGGRLVTPPRYYDSLMDSIDEELMSDIKLKRTDIAEQLQSYKDMLSTADIKLRNEYAERNKLDQVSKLIRTLD